MKRFSSSVALATLFGLVGCKGGASSDPVKLVPDVATMVGGVNVKGLMSSQLYADHKETFESGETKEMMEAAKGCKLDPNGVSGMVFGADPASNGFVVVISAPGIGKEDNLNCIAGKVKEKAGEDPWTLEEKDGKKVLSMQGGEGIGYLVGDDMIAVASTSWADSVKQLIDGKGAAAVDGTLKDLVGRAPKDKHIWFAGSIPADAAAGLKGTPGESVKDFSGGLDVSNGLAVSLAAGVGTPENATALQGELQKQFDGLKGMAPAIGIPQGVVDSVKIAAAEASVTVHLSASNDDLKALKDKMGGMMGGMMGGGLGGGGMSPPEMAAPPVDPAAAPADGAPPAPADGAPPIEGAPPAPADDGAAPPAEAPTGE